MSTPPARRLPHWTLCIALVSLLPIFVIAKTWSTPTGHFTADVGVKVLQVRALADGSDQVHYPLHQLDPEQRYRPIQAPFGVDGDSPKSFSTIYRNPMIRCTAALYSLFSSFAFLLIPFLSFLGIMLASISLGRSLGIKPSVSVLGVGLLTPTWFYGAVFWEHAPATALVLSSFVLLLGLTNEEERSLRLRRLFLITLLGVLAVSLRPESAIAISSMGIVMMWGTARKVRLELAIVGLTCALVLGVVLVMSPTLLPVGQVQHNVTDPDFQFTDWLFWRQVHYVVALAGTNVAQVELDYVNHWDQPAFTLAWGLLAVWILSMVFNNKLGKTPRLRFSLRLIVALVAMSAPFVFASVELAQPAGLLISCPVLFWLTWDRDHLVQGRLFWATALFLFLSALTMPNSGGLQVGPRYLLPAIPVATLLALRELITILGREGRTLKLGVLTALVAGFAAQGVAIAHVLEVDNQRDELHSILEDADVDLIVSKDPYAPCTMPTEVLAGKVLYLPSGSDYAAIEEELARRGVRRFAWLRPPPKEIPIRQIYERKVIKPAFDKMPAAMHARFRFGRYETKAIHLTPSFPGHRASIWVYAR